MMCAIDDGEPFNCSRHATPRARKEHPCCECGRMIQRGEVYDFVRGYGEGGWQEYKTCTHCLAAATWLTVECNGYCLGGIAEDLIEHVGHGDESYPEQRWLIEAVAGLRAKWRTPDGALMAPLAEYRRAA